MNSSSRSRGRKVLLVAVLGDRDALDQLHDEVGPALSGGAGVEHLGDVRMVHHGQRLPLGFKTSQDLSRIHADFDELERDAALDRLRLFGDPDGAHAPFAKLLQESVRTDDDADVLGEALADHGFGRRRMRLVAGISRSVHGEPRIATPRLLCAARASHSANVPGRPFGGSKCPSRKRYVAVPHGISTHADRGEFARNSSFSRTHRKSTDKCRLDRKPIRLSAAVRSRIAMRFVGVEPSGAGR